MQRADIVAIADLAVDILLAGDDLTPEYGQKEKLVPHARFTLGGSGGIFAMQAARLGLRVRVLGKVGRDPLGRFLLDTMAVQGVDVAGVIQDATVGTCFGLHFLRGDDRAMLTYLGAVGSMTPVELKACDLAAGRHVHWSSFFLQAGLRSEALALLSEARRAGLTTSVDYGFDPEERWEGAAELLSAADVVFCNEAELLGISGSSTLREALAWARQRVGVTALKLGARGAAVVSADQEWFAPALPVKVVDTVGAGDSFAGGFLRAYLDRLPLPDCLAHGIVCGSLSARAAGGTAGQPDRETLAEFLPHIAVSRGLPEWL